MFNMSGVEPTKLTLSRFLEVFDIDKEEIEKIKTDEVALMKLGFKYIKYLLILEETLKVKKGYLKTEKNDK